MEGLGLPWRTFLEDLEVFLGGIIGLGLPWRTFLEDLKVFLRGAIGFPWKIFQKDLRRALADLHGGTRAALEDLLGGS